MNEVDSLDRYLNGEDCPSCENPMAWVSLDSEHLEYICKFCGTRHCFEITVKTYE